MKSNSTLETQYQNYDCQQCFVAHSIGAEWSEDLKSACIAILPKFNLEPWYAADQFDPTQTLRDKVVELIANSRYGIYDISSWQDKKGNWQLPQNVFLELGIAIALNRPILLLRHSSNQNLPLPTCLQGVDLVEFTGDITLKKELEKRIPQWLDTPPDQGWLNRFCLFGNRGCSYREEHPHSQQWGKQTLHCHISDGLDKDHHNYCQSECDEIRGTFEDIFSRYSNLKFSYLEDRSIADCYELLLCSHCQIVRSTPFAIYRISPTTSAETFISIGISIALEKLFSYKIPKILLVKQEQDLPSLLRGYEIVEVSNMNEIKQKLKAFLPKVIKNIRETKWQSKPLPFIESAIIRDNQSSSSELEVLSTVDNQEQYKLLSIAELNVPKRVCYALKRANINFISDLLGYTIDDILELKGIGLKAIDEIVRALNNQYGIVLPSEVSKISFDFSIEADIITSRVSLYHRKESSNQTAEIAKLQEDSLEIHGKKDTNNFAGGIPKVKAYYGSLPDSERGIEFTTDIEPDLGSNPKLPNWSGERLGVFLSEDKETAILKVLTVSNYQDSTKYPDYQQLENYLKNQQWKEADRETYDLINGIIGNTENQEFITPQELLDFPTDELIKIDELWTNYSRGKFGFSIQKKIYVRYTVNSNDKYPGHEILNHFGEVIGWRRDEKWWLYRSCYAKILLNLVFIA
jgi:hypothetical protein